MEVQLSQFKLCNVLFGQRLERRKSFERRFWEWRTDPLRGRLDCSSPWPSPPWRSWTPSSTVTCRTWPRVWASGLTWGYEASGGWVGRAASTRRGGRGPSGNSKGWGCCPGPGAVDLVHRRVPLTLQNREGAIVFTLCWGWLSWELTKTPTPKGFVWFRFIGSTQLYQDIS